MTLVWQDVVWVRDDSWPGWHAILAGAEDTALEGASQQPALCGTPPPGISDVAWPAVADAPFGGTTCSLCTLLLESPEPSAEERWWLEQEAAEPDHRQLWREAQGLVDHRRPS